MKQPLMLTPVRIPPAQAEALYDASLESGPKSSLASQEAHWSDDDWDDEAFPLPARGSPAATGKGAIAQH